MKRKVLEKIREANLLEQHELDYIIKELNKNKKYGLVWEDHPEDVELELKDGIFRIEELRDKRIETNLEGRENLLLEGDNLHSLMALKDAGVKVDVIYIDPPYNTLNETGFRYNDKRVDLNDNYRHSKWLSFMYKRLELARDLMTDDGVIFVSIDDNEQANLRLLMNQVFGEENFIETFIWERTTHFGRQAKNTYTNTEYIHSFAKALYDNKNELKTLLADSIQYSFEDAPLYNASNNTQELTFRAGTVRFLIPDGIYAPFKSDKYQLLHEVHVKNGVNENSFKMKFRSRWGQEKLDEQIKLKGHPLIKSDLFAVRFVYGDREPHIKSVEKLLDANYGTNQMATKEIKKIIGDNTFQYTKPYQILKYLISASTWKDNDKNATVLDFFAGSGTTGHAVMELNKEDGGNRRFILCTNNENNICEEVTYERNRRVITGEYAKEKVEPLPNNLSYYKVDILNRNSINYKEKEKLEVVKNKYLAEWKEDVKIIKENEEYALMENSNKKVLFIKTGIISESTKEDIDLNSIDKIYMMKHLSRDKMFKGVDESKLELI